MIEQQLNISDHQLKQEAQINWGNIRKLYIQSTKSKLPPEPDYAGTSHLYYGKQKYDKLQIYFEQIISEFNLKHIELIEFIDKKYKDQIKELRLRIERLQNILFQQKNSEKKTEQLKISFTTPYRNPYPQKQQVQIQSTETKAKPQKSYIHIEEDSDHEVSLLDEDPFQQISDPSNQKSKRNSRKSQNNFTPRSIHTEIIKEQKQIVYIGAPTIQIHDEEVIYQDGKRSFNVSCKFHEQILSDLKIEIEYLKEYMRNVHNIDIEGAPWLQHPVIKSLETNDPLIIMNLSTNAQRHLRNENQKLRQFRDRYKQELIKTKKQVRYLKNLMKGVMELYRKIKK